MNKIARIIYVMVFIISSALYLSACSSQSKNSAAMSSPYRADYGAVQMATSAPQVAYETNTVDAMGVSDMAHMEEKSIGGTGAAPSSTGGEVSADNDKIIKTCNIQMESQNFSRVTDEIRNIVAEKNGYIESSNTYSVRINYDELKRFSAVLKIPAAEYETVKAFIEGLSKINSSSEYSENVGFQYVDIENRLKTKRIEEERLLDMISRSENIENLIMLEERLSQIRTTIEGYESQLKTYDRQVAYSTIRIDLSEVREEKIQEISPDLWQRIKSSFAGSVNSAIKFFEEVIIFIVGMIIPILIISVLIIVGITIFKSNKNKKRRD